MLLLIVLDLVALAYFAFVIWRADGLATILLRSRYSERGWTQARMTSRLRLLGSVGVAVAVVTAGIAVTKMVG
jgi:hypothetical protein